MAWSYRERSEQLPPLRPDPAEDRAGPPAIRNDRGWSWRDIAFWCGAGAVSVLALGWLLARTPLPPQPTASISLRGNLDAGSPVGARVRTTAAVVDSQRRRHLLAFVFHKQAVDAWRLTATVPAGGARTVGAADILIAFRPDGSFADVRNPPARIVLQVHHRLEPQTVHLDFGAPGSFAGLTQLPEAPPAPRQPVLIAFQPSRFRVSLERSAAPCAFSYSR